MRPAPTIADVIGAAAFAFTIGLIAGAQFILRQQREAADCDVAVAAERQCMERLVELQGTLGELLTICHYGEGIAPQGGI